MKNIILGCFLFSLSLMNAQTYFPKNDGVQTTDTPVVAFTNATIFITPTNQINNGTLLIKEGKVVAVGKRVAIPKEATVIDLAGKSVYPSFIDPYTSFGIGKITGSTTHSNTPQYDAERTGYYWNDHIRPETNPMDNFQFSNTKAKEFLKAGFGVVNTHVPDGIVRGTGVLVALNTKSSDAYRILNPVSGQYLSFKKSKKSKQLYPGSLMGAMALLRQVYNDADWYTKGFTKNTDLALEAFTKNAPLTQIFEPGSKASIFRADKVGDAFDVQYTFVGNGDEYENIEAIKATHASFIVPINFRKAYDASNPFLTKHISLHDMRKWQQEPANLAVLSKNNVSFALTTHQLKSPAAFTKNIQKAIQHGLTETAALRALTTTPAELLNNTKIGNLRPGSYANFLIASGPIFKKGTTLYENWVQGSKHVLQPMHLIDLTGTYALQLNAEEYHLTIAGKPAKQTVVLKKGEQLLKSTFAFKDGWFSLTARTLDSTATFFTLSSRIAESATTLKGTATDTNGLTSSWTAEKEAVKTDSKPVKKEKTHKTPELVPVSFPNNGYGRIEKPAQETILFKNATVWTSEKEGVLPHTDVLIKHGKIVKIGKQLRAKNAKIIDATGKHLTAGIIDEHSHIAAASINEWAQNSSAEVSIEDVINPEDINIYRNLAGGVTSIQILHGSANPIGGKSAIIKLKWGEDAEAMRYKDGPKFIKFALGENVKQSRSPNGVRFPQTRMGVEQVFVDYFTRAKTYDALKKSGKPYRKDAELETLAEILNKERFISCHSYVQSEINMLMKVAERFDFNINTFTHILEGYKVADKMKAHGVGASTFSDWWAYKYEVNDAIPYNAAILHKQGITVAINSDDAEMSRRLNQEAAKSVKYGGLSEADAWKMITINPAKLLHIDTKVGSIQKGKDADLVLWSGHPLSIYSKAEKTFIEGRMYFDVAADLKKREAIKKERNFLLAAMLKEKIKGAKVTTPKQKKAKAFHCDTLE